MELINGVYFFHESFLKEVSNKWLVKREIGNEAKLFINVINKFRETNKLITSDRTFDEMSKQKYALLFVPAFYDEIIAHSLPNESNSTNDEYSLKVASLKGISNLPTFFIVSDSEKKKYEEMSIKLGYKSFKVVSSEDYLII